MHSDIIENFLAELDAHPKCRAAGLRNPALREWELDNLRQRLTALYNDGNTDARVIDLFDMARAVMRNRRGGMHARLVELRALLLEWRSDALTLPVEQLSSRSASAAASTVL
jgi:hypothetical protein